MHVNVLLIKQGGYNKRKSVHMKRGCCAKGLFEKIRRYAPPDKDDKAE